MPESVNGLRSLIVPLQEAALILPSAVVAEVSSYVEPVPANSGPAWLVGHTNWRQQELPVVSMEAAMGGETPADFGQRARIIVLYSLEHTEQLPFFGLISKGIPRAYLASRDNILPVADDSPEPGSFVRARVDLQPEGQALIPDLDALQDAMLGLQPG